MPPLLLSLVWVFASLGPVFGRLVSEFDSSVSIPMVSTSQRQQAFTIAFITVDIRHLTTYEGGFTLNEDWKIVARFTESKDRNVTLVRFGKQVPEPSGVKFGKDSPLYLSAMVPAADPRRSTTAR